MRGRIELLNPRNGCFAVRTADGLTVIETLGVIDVEIGDGIAGDLDEHGSVTLRHVESGDEFDAFIQAVDTSEQSARELLA